MTSRRAFVKTSLGLPLLAAGSAGLIGGLAAPKPAAAADYRALVVLFLNGGNDGNDCLVPTDGAYSDYAAAHQGLALPRSRLVTLAGSSAGHTFGMNVALAPLAALYNQRRLAWVANVGPLVRPATAAQVLDAAVEVPPFLLSHSDQVAIQQGWTGDEDPSGWAGRALELLAPELRHDLSAVTMDSHRTLVQGRRSLVSWIGNNVGARYWNNVDFAYPDAPWARLLIRDTRLRFANAYKSEYARSMGANVADAIAFTKALQISQPPQADFPADSLGDSLRMLAQLLPAFRTLGYRRQVFLVNWGAFDTHATQRGTAKVAQDYQLDIVARAAAAFDQSVRASGLDGNVITLMMSDFGRTLKPASGGGTDHAWGNHWFLFGGPVAGGRVYGTFPALRLRGPDDADPDGDGRFVPTTSTDQVGATLMQWLGLPSSQFEQVFPNLANFPQKTLAFLQA